MSLVQVENVVKTFGEQNALNGLTLNFDQANHYAILGASGSGKSTLLYLIGGLDQPTSGRILVGGKELHKMNDSELANYRNEYVGFVFQFHFLLPSTTCLKNILLPAEIGGHKLGPVKKRAEKLAEYLGVGHCLEKNPYQLSGGEQQRINIVRALSLKPKLLLCDEPTGNLDSENSKKVTQLLIKLAGEFGSTLLVVTHDLNVAKNFENKFVLRDGQLCQDGPLVEATLPNLPT